MRKLLNEELDRLDVDSFKQADKIPIAVVLDNVRSMNNIGSIFRTSDAFRIESISLCGITATPPHKEIHKTALGATESVDWNYYKDTKEVLSGYKDKDYVVCAVEQAEGSQFLGTFNIDITSKYVLVFGHEIKGVQQEVMDLCDICLEIPQYGTKHSLNISVAAGVVTWEFFRKFRGIIA